MILKSININGFKSFGKKVTIDVTHNVTGVVGPNGSGKSNVAEAIRFVLGEQSMKNMRSKLSADLIFKGSNSLNALNRASVEMIIDNRERKIKQNVSHDLALYLEYDEIKLSRELYADGESKYRINEAIVRLKDVQELLALAGIGNSAHTIISQGEADRILLANSKERKEILEDALGLKVYHLRIKESEKKLEKVEEHKREIEIIKRELASELYELGRMVRIIEARREEMNRLELYVRYYVHREKSYIHKRINELTNVYGQGEDDRYYLNDNVEDLQSKLLSIEAELNNHEELRQIKNDLFTFENKFKELNDKYNQLSGQKQALIQIQSGAIGVPQPEIEEIISFSKKALETHRYNIDKKLDNAIYNAVHNNNAGVISNIGDARAELDNIFKKEKKSPVIKNDYSDQLYDIEQALESLLRDKQSAGLELSQAKSKLDEREARRYQLLEDKNNIQSRIKDIEYMNRMHEGEKKRLSERQHNVDNLWQEMAHMLGLNLLTHQGDIDENNELYNMPMSELERKIEKSRMRIDDGGIADSANIIKDYEELVERDKFLDNELIDISRTGDELRRLIEDLEATLREDFNKGIEKISFVFNNYFHEVFGGGRAKLSIGVVPLPLREGSGVGVVLGDERGSGEDELIIDINIPEKKVKDLHMLSGGERSLVSIALIFAMSSIAPPPFIVLDETDAALDELNAKRYGQMLNKLAERSKLLVITHNRATMNECDVLYGVTLGADGASRMLSIKFEK